MRKLTLFGLLGAVLIFAYGLDRHLTGDDRESPGEGGSGFGIPGEGPELVVTLGGSELPTNLINIGLTQDKSAAAKSGPGSNTESKPAASSTPKVHSNRPPPPSPIAAKGGHLVIDGETWDSIAQLRYDDSCYAHHLAQLNSLDSRKRPKAGTRLRIPPVNELERRYVVRPNDSLSAIAQDKLGTMMRAKDIAALNNLKGLDNITVGQTLVLPR